MLPPLHGVCVYASNGVTALNVFTNDGRAQTFLKLVNRARMKGRIDSGHAVRVACCQLIQVRATLQGRKTTIGTGPIDQDVIAAVVIRLGFGW